MFSSIQKWFAPIIGEMPEARTEGGFRWSRYSQFKRGDHKELFRLYKSNARFRAPLSRIASDVAAVKWRCNRIDANGKRTEIFDHDLIRIWNRPNSFQTGSQFRKMIQLHLDICGYAIVEIVRDGSGRPISLTPIIPDNISGFPDIDRAKRENDPSFFNFKVTSSEGPEVEIPPSNILWFASTEVDSIAGGGSLAYSLADDINQDNLAGVWNNSLYKNLARVPHVISIHSDGNEDIEQSDIQAIADDLKSSKAGAENAGKDLVVPARVSVTPLVKSPQEMDFHQTKLSLARAIRIGAGVPPEILGDVDNSNRATAQAAIELHQKFNILPRIRYLEEAVGSMLTPIYGDSSIELVPEDPVEKSKEFILQRSTEGLKIGAITVNEWRESQGLDPLPEGGDERLIPLNYASDRNGERIEYERTDEDKNL